ncbi:glycosyltransferase [Pannus brasiliensis]|uniref:glycosyltransferase n=1 Tax=Pannus brasiliensis TaxID=1579216 RepID=UPI003BEEB963
MPRVAFKRGEMPELIDPGESGYFAEPSDSEDLAGGIARVLEEPERHERSRARKSRAGI